MKAADQYYQDRPPGFGDPREDFKAGARYAAALTQALGEILQRYTDAMTPKDLIACRHIFLKNKEIVDDQNP